MHLEAKFWCMNFLVSLMSPAWIRFCYTNFVTFIVKILFLLTVDHFCNCSKTVVELVICQQVEIFSVILRFGWAESLKQ